MDRYSQVEFRKDGTCEFSKISRMYKENGEFEKEMKKVKRKFKIEDNKLVVFNWWYKEIFEFGFKNEGEDLVLQSKKSLMVLGKELVRSLLKSKL